MNNLSMDTKSFEALAELAYNESGLQLVAEKTSMIQSRLRHRLREVGLDNFSSYAEFVCSDRGLDERREMISALTTNVSHFFREMHHFEIFSSKILPQAMERARNGDRIRVWSAGCSNGQEAYSVALEVLEKFPDLSGLDFKILATDIDPKVVAFGRAGIYPERFVSGIPPNLLSRYFSKFSDGDETCYEVCSDAKQLVVFKELNLLSEWPIKNTFDVIFCRNVVIYFDLYTQNKLWPRFHNHLNQDGFLFLGHSERISDPEASGFHNDGPTAYRPIKINNS
ncbi:MAG: protein-glutamate O-methyltransferase CheR [Roseobacter sp.]